MEAEPTWSNSRDPDEEAWLVFQRDGSDSVSVRGKSRVFVAMVLEVSTGLIVGAGGAPSGQAALDRSLNAAMAQVGVGHPVPRRLLCPGDQLAAVRAAAHTAGLRAEVIPTELPPEVEEILDSMLGALGGYQAAVDPPSGKTWSALMAASFDYLDNAPWIRVPDSFGLPLELETPSGDSRYMAVVLGFSELEHGLVLLAQSSLPPAQVLAAESMPEGALGMALIEPSEMPVAGRRARRFGWPQEIEPIPLFYVGRESGAGEPSQAEADRLLLAMAAIDAFDRSDHMARRTGSIRGRMQLPDGGAGRFRVSAPVPLLGPEQPDDPWASPAARPTMTLDVRSTLVREDLLPRGTVVHMGGMRWKLLPRAREQAEIHTDPPVPQTRTGAGLPVLAIQPRGRDGVALAKRILASEPQGLMLIDDQAEALVVLLCQDGLYGIIEVASDGPEAARFRARLAASGGDHAILVATFSGPHPKRIFGLFECHLDFASSRPKPAPRPARRRPKRH